MVFGQSLFPPPPPPRGGRVVVVVPTAVLGGIGVVDGPVGSGGSVVGEGSTSLGGVVMPGVLSSGSSGGGAATGFDKVAAGVVVGSVVGTVGSTVAVVSCSTRPYRHAPGQD